MTPSAADTTVVVSTYASERWEALLACVDSLRRQAEPPREIVVVVDRNPRLLQRVRSALPDVAALENDAFPGAGGARNAGLARVGTEIVAFLDDDAEATPGWLADHLKAYADPLTIGTGGRLEPAWEGSRPAWFPPEFDWVVGCTFEGMPAKDGALRNPISANMTVRTSALRTVGGFRTDFGKVGTVSLPEDTDLGIRVLEAFPGHRWRYRPDATALHRVQPERATLAYFCRRCWYEGTGKAELAARVGTISALASEREYSRRVLPRAVARGLGESLARRDPRPLLRSGAVVLGFDLTALAYLASRLRTGVPPEVRSAASVGRRRRPSGPRVPAARGKLVSRDRSALGAGYGVRNQLSSAVDVVSATRSDALDLEILSSEAELEELQPGWDELVARMPRPSPFLLNEWLASWWRHFGGDRRLAVHVARRGSALVGALPLFEMRTPIGVPVARFVGAPDSTFADVVAPADADGHVTQLLVEQALGAHGLLDLFALAPGGHLARTVAPAELFPRTEAPVLELDEGWEAAYARKTSSKRRALHRRRRRQLEERGPVAVTVAREGPEFDDALEEAFALHALRWEGRPDVSTFSGGRGMRFHREALAALARDGFVRLVTLRVARRPVAFTCYFALAGRMFVYRIAFDPELARLSPGIVTTLESIGHAAGEGATAVEFLRGTERYKLELADRVDTLGEAVLDGGGALAGLTRTTLTTSVRLRRALGARRRRLRATLDTLKRRGGLR